MKDNEYFIFLIETVQKNKDNSLNSVSQDIVLSLPNKYLNSNNIIGKVDFNSEKIKLVFKNHKHLNLLEKLSRIFKSANFDLSVDEDFNSKVETQEPILQRSSAPQSPLTNKPKIYEDDLSQVFICPHLTSSDDPLDANHVKGMSSKDAYNCLLECENKTCPFESACKEHKFFYELRRKLGELLTSSPSDLYIFNFTNYDRFLKLTIDKNGTMGLAGLKVSN